MDEKERLDLARRLYVEQGKKRAEIAVDLDISIFVLDKYIKEENWDQQRTEFMEGLKALKASGNSLHLHNAKLQAIYAQVDIYMVQLNNAQTSTEVRLIKDKLEALHHAGEILSAAINDERTVNGVKKAAPSVTPEGEEVEGVAFKVYLPGAKNQTGTA